MEVDIEKEALTIAANTIFSHGLIPLSLKDAEERAEEYLDFLRSTKQLVAFGYWQQRRRELRAEEAKRMTA